MQQFTLEYRVSGKLDGTTPSPVFSIDPSSPDFKAPDPDGIYRFDIEGNLGFIDPDFDTGGSQGDRFLRALVLNTAPPGESISDLVGVVALDEEVFGAGGLLLEIVASLDAETEATISKGCVFIPQGAVLALRGADADVPPGVVASIVRISIDVPDSLVEYAEMLQTCCCEAEADTACTTPTITNVNPGGLDINSLSVPMTVTGTNFSPQAEVSVVPQFVGPNGTISFIVITETEINFDIDDLPAGDGDYAVVVSNGDGCAVQASFFVFFVRPD